MAYDHDHYEMLARALGAMDGLSERNMFGGKFFMLHGNMLMGVVKSGVMARVGPGGEEAALALPGVVKGPPSGRKMSGVVTVEAGLLDDREALDQLIALAVEFVGPMPAK
ncbi:MAG: TfoX/Sxy family protein [Pseudomonadota bacterium]